MTSRLLSDAGFVHAFFTRRGGVSKGAFESLNLSFGVGDEPESVRENRTRAARVLGLEREKLMTLSQVHSAAWVEIDGQCTADELAGERGDALMSDDPDLACSVQTADCVPVLVADCSSGRVAAIHAGWRGTVANITGKVVRELATRAPRAHLIAAIGPHISASAFEVSEEVAKQLAAASSAKSVVIEKPSNRPHVDLRRIVRAQLEEAGLAAACIEDVFGCTLLDEDSFFSYRRSGRQSGRHLSAIRAKGA